MKVYSVLCHVQYEGTDLLGVFASRDEAVVFAKSKQDKWSEMGVVESELGQEIDVFGDVEWLED